jgi:hypothetical protein
MKPKPGRTGVSIQTCPYSTWYHDHPLHCCYRSQQYCSSQECFWLELDAKKKKKEVMNAAKPRPIGL